MKRVYIRRPKKLVDVESEWLGKKLLHPEFRAEAEAEAELIRREVRPFFAAPIKSGEPVMVVKIVHNRDMHNLSQLNPSDLAKPTRWLRTVGSRLRPLGARFAAGATALALRSRMLSPEVGVSVDFTFLVAMLGDGSRVQCERTLRNMAKARGRRGAWPKAGVQIASIGTLDELDDQINATWDGACDLTLPASTILGLPDEAARSKLSNASRRHLGRLYEGAGGCQLSSFFGLARNGDRLVRRASGSRAQPVDLASSVI